MVELYVHVGNTSAPRIGCGGHLGTALKHLAHLAIVRPGAQLRSPEERVPWASSSSDLSTAGSQGQWQRFRRSAGTFQNESGCAAEARLAHGVSPRPVAGKLAGREVTVKRPWLACHARQPIACYQDPPGSHLDGSDEQSERDFAEACAG